MRKSSREAYSPAADGRPIGCMGCEAVEDLRGVCAAEPSSESASALCIPNPPPLPCPPPPTPPLPCPLPLCPPAPPTATREDGVPAAAAPPLLVTELWRPSRDIGELPKPPPPPPFVLPVSPLQPTSLDGLRVRELRRVPSRRSLMLMLMADFVKHRDTWSEFAKSNWKSRLIRPDED